MAGQAEQHQWKDAVQQQLNDLSQVVRDIQEQTSQRTDGEVLESVHSLQQGQQLVQEELQRLQYGLNEHLESLEQRVSELSDISEFLKSLPRPSEKQNVETLTLIGQGVLQPTQAEPSLAASPEPGVFEISSGWEFELPEVTSQGHSHRETHESKLPPLESTDWLDQWTAIPSSSPASASEQQLEREPRMELIEPTDPKAFPDSQHDYRQNEVVVFDSLAGRPAAYSRDHSPGVAESPQGEVGHWNENHSDEFAWSDEPEPSSTDRPSTNFPIHDSPAESGTPDSPSTQTEVRSQWASEPDEGNIKSHQPKREMRSSNEQSEFFFGTETFKAELRNDPITHSESTLQDSRVLRVEDSRLIEDSRLAATSGAIESSLPSWWTDEEAEQRSAQSDQSDQSAQSDQSDQSDQSEPSDQLASSSEQLQPEAWTDDVRELVTAEPEELPDSGYEASSVLDSQVKDLSTLLDSFKEKKPEIADVPLEEQEETSVEDYMKSLLARMRGEPATIGEPSAQNQAPKRNPPALTHSPTTTQTEQPEITDSNTSATSEVAFGTETYISWAKAPEKTKSMNAMRELANNSARQAVHKSTRQRYLSASLFKLAISVIALTVAGALFAINGLSLNVGLIATLASLLVAAIWGYDGFTGLKPLLQSSLVLAPPAIAECDESSE